MSRQRLHRRLWAVAVFASALGSKSARHPRAQDEWAAISWASSRGSRRCGFAQVQSAGRRAIRAMSTAAVTRLTTITSTEVSMLTKSDKSQASLRVGRRNAPWDPKVHFARAGSAGHGCHGPVGLARGTYFRSEMLVFRRVVGSTHLLRHSELRAIRPGWPQFSSARIA